MSGESAATPLLAFIVPAFNEAAMIGATLTAIHRAVGTRPHEIVVVDSGSTDGTPAIAAEQGARVVVHRGGTIGAMRNRGVRETTGAIVVFLDADVVLTPAWTTRFPVTLDLLAREPRTLTGAMCVVPAQASWIERLWFAPRDIAVFSHIGTGHLITTRTFFDEIGGFDETLATGEDQDFSHRAVARGGQLRPDTALVAEHHGYPHTLGAFVRREAWHGYSDFESVSRILASKVALATLYFAAANLLAVAGLVTGSVPALLGGVTAVAALCAVSSFAKYRRQPLSIIAANAVIYYAYYFGRLLALLRLGPGRAARRVKAPEAVSPAP